MILDTFSGLLRHWRKRFQLNQASNGLELGGVEQLRLELREAKRELARVQQERDILKKRWGSSRGRHANEIRSGGGVCRDVPRFAGV